MLQHRFAGAVERADAVGEQLRCILTIALRLNSRDRCGRMPAQPVPPVGSGRQPVRRTRSRIPTRPRPANSMATECGSGTGVTEAAANV